MAIASIQKVGSFQGTGNVIYQNLTGSPTSGDLWFDHSNVALKIYNGSSWDSFSSSTGDITSVTAGSGLTGGGTSGEVTLNVVGGYGITVNADDVEVSNADIRGLISATGNISYNSTTGVISESLTTDDIDEGTTNLYYTDARSRASISVSGDLGYDSGTGVISFTERTDAEVRGLFGVSGDLAYNSSTGVFSFTERTEAETRALISAGGDLSYNSTTGEMSFTQRTDAQVRALISAGGDLSYNNTTGVMSFTERTDSEVRGLISASGDLSYDSGTGVISYTMPALVVSDFNGAAIQTSAEGFSDSDTVLMTAAAVDDRILSYGYTTNVGDITGVTAGNGLTGGGTSGSVTLNVGAGTGVTVAADSVSIGQDVGTSDSVTFGSVQTTTLTTGSNSTAGTVTGDWTLTAGSTWQATYADLAEKYTTDQEYEPGTVMKFGGTAELTQTDTANDHRVAGVVSTNPAYILNSSIEGQTLALTGRVPVKVTGSVSPGDILVSSNVPGHAEVNNDAKSGTMIGKAITADANGVCEALVNLM